MSPIREIRVCSIALTRAALQGVFTNGGAGCTSVFFIDASPAVNGKPVAAAPGAAGRRLAQTNGVGASLLPGYGGEVSLNMVFSIGATGKPGVPVDSATRRKLFHIAFLILLAFQ